MTENTTRNQRGKPFRKGESGNPAGKPKGARHKTTLLAEKLMQDDAKNIVNAVLKAAKDGDMTAARMVIDRISPARRDNPVQLALPKIETAADAAKAMSALFEGIASGVITPDEAERISRLLQAFVSTLETVEIEHRLRVLEEKVSP